MIILRIKYIKENNMKFLSHLELIKTLERAFRRMNFKMAFSQGFNPKPKISYAAPLPVGVETECDYLDVELLEKVDLKDLLDNQKDYLPNGLEFVEARYRDKSKKMMALITDSEYIVKLSTEEVYTKDSMQGKLDAFVGQREITYEKMTKKKKLKLVDVKPYIQKFDIVSIEDNQLTLKCMVTTGSNGNLKPEKLAELFCTYAEINRVEGKDRYRRVALYTRDRNKQLITLFEV
jgi:radical SAM-linked protein